MESSADIGADVFVPTELLRELASTTTILLGRVQPELVPLPEATALLDAFADLERRAAAGRLLVASRATLAGEWKRSGFASPEEWLAARHGTSRGRARDDLKASERLKDLDDTSDALRRGDLSPEQAGTIADAAAVNPDAERDLLERAAQDSLAGLRDEAARRKAEREDQARKHERIRRERSCRTWTDRDGAWNLRARGPIADAAGFSAELERLVARHGRDARRILPEDQWETNDQYGFDVLVGLTDRHEAATEDEPSRADEQRADETEEGSSRTSRRSPSPAPRHLAMIRVDLSALVRGHVTDGELCEIAGFGPIPVADARRLLGDSIVKLVLTNGVDVVNVTHAGRGPRIAQQIALLWANPKCCVAGCDRTRGLEFDHADPYAAIRVTELANIRRPCCHHHDLKTYEGWDYSDEIATDGRIVLVPPDDPRHPRHPHRTDSSGAHAVGNGPDPPSLFVPG